MRTAPLVGAVTTGSVASGLALGYLAVIAKWMILHNGIQGLAYILIAALAVESIWAANRISKRRAANAAGAAAA